MMLVVLAASLSWQGGDRRDRRVVDIAAAGNAHSEADHGYAGEGASVGAANGKTFRQTRGWMRYSLAVFGDTEVTVACTFLGSAGVPLTYDILIEDRLVATRTFTTPSSTPVVVDFTVPFGITRGMTNVVVTIRARGGVTPALLELRTVQDHLEDTELSLATSLRSQTLRGSDQ